MWRREDFAMAGCIVTIGQDGALQVIAGLVKPEDMPKPEESDAGGAATGNGHDPDAAPHGAHVHVPSMAPPMAPPKDREAEARKEAGVGIGLADDLRSIRTALVKAYLAGDFEAAFDLLLFQMGRSVFTFGYKGQALDIAVRETADRPTTRMNDADFADWSPGEAMLEDRSGLPLDWLEIEDDGESFAALRALPVSDKKALFAASVARTVKPQLAFEPQARPELEATVARLDIDFAAHVRPTAAMLWSRINKSRILDIARTVLGISWASARAKSKKAAIAEAMETAFAAGDRPVSLSAEMHAAALAWTPPGFAAFDTGRIGDDPETDEPAAESPEAETAGSPEATEPAASTGTVSTDAPPAADGNGHAVPAGPAPEASSSKTGDESDGDTGEATAGSGETPLPEDLAAAVDAANRVPTADGGPRVVIAHVGPGADTEPGSANGQDASGDPLEIPEFLRRVR